MSMLITHFFILFSHIYTESVIFFIIFTSYRKSHGGFKTVDELVNVKGIGPKTLLKMKSQVAIR